MSHAAAPVGLISNPNSGHNRNQFERIERRIARCECIQHAVTHSAEDVFPALQRFAEQGITVLAINGGDGTASTVLGCLLESTLFDPLPYIALLPGGTANMNAGDIGVRGKLTKAIERFCRWCESERPIDGKLAKRALLRVLHNEEPPRYGMFLGGGAIIHGTEYAHQNIHSRGLRDDLSLALGTVRTVWGVVRNDPAFNKHVEISVTLDDGTRRQHDTLILVVSTLHRLAFGMRPFWSQQPGAIRLTVFEQGCSKFARTFISIIRGKPSSNAVSASGYRSHNTHKMTLEMQGKLNLDGEIFEVGSPAENATDCASAGIAATSRNGTVTVQATQALEFLQL